MHSASTPRRLTWISSPFLASEIVAAIIEGTHAADLTADRLFQNLERPLDWIDQRALLLDR